MTCILHISDTHFGTEVSSVEAAFWQAIATIQPDVVVHSGDVTQRARDHEFAKADVFFAKFGALRKLVVPGNHDIPLWNVSARFIRPYAGFERTFAELEPSYEDPTTLIITLNTTRPWRHKNGTCSRRQVERVSERVRAAEVSQLRIVVAHHPVHIPSPREQHNQLRGNAEAATAWSRAGVDLILGGHIHWPYFVPLPDHWWPAISQCWVAQAGTAISRRTRRGLPNSFNVIRRQARGYTLERWDYAAEGARFVTAACVDVQLPRLADA